MERINMKSTSLAKVILVVLVIVLGMQIKASMAQDQNTCANQLGSLNVCAPFVLRDTQNSVPSAECCGALQAIEPGCLCNAIRVASQLPSACKLSSLSCGNTILSKILMMKMVSFNGCVGDEEACNVAAPNCCSGLQCQEVSPGVHQCENSSCEQHIGHSCEPGLRACCAPLRCSQNTAGSFQCTA